MPMTVDQAVSEVVGRLAGKLAFVGLSVVRDATNPDVTPAVRDALYYFERIPADYPTVVDDDLATLTEPTRFLDAATLLTLYRIQGSFAFVDMKVDKNQQWLSQFRDDLADMIRLYLTLVPNLTGAAVGTLAVPAAYPSPYPLPTCDPATFFDRGPWGYPWT